MYFRVELSYETAQIKVYLDIKHTNYSKFMNKIFVVELDTK